MTLGRTMIRRAMRWDDPRAVEGTEKPKRILGLSYEWPMRISFFVERPCGTSFSQELASALEHAGFAIVSDPRYEGTDECVWYASRNSDHLNEILGFIAEAERALDPAWEDSCEQADAVIAERIRQVGGVYCYASDWKCFEPEYQAAQLRRSLGFRVRWRHSDEYRVGTYEFNLTVPG